MTGNGLYHLRTNPVMNIVYSPPITIGTHTKGIYNSLPCCNNYLPKAEPDEEVSTNKNESTLSIYPNPTFNHQFVIQLEAESTGLLEIEIFDLTGRLIYSKNQVINSTHKQYHIPVQLAESLSNGIYITKSKLNNQIFTNKIIGLPIKTSFSFNDCFRAYFNHLV